jgi:hypothetical protein
MLVFVPYQVAFHFGKFDIVVVQLANDVGMPVLGEFGEFFI